MGSKKWHCTEHRIRRSRQLPEPSHERRDNSHATQINGVGREQFAYASSTHAPCVPIPRVRDMEVVPKHATGRRENTVDLSGDRNLFFVGKDGAQDGECEDEAERFIRKLQLCGVPLTELDLRVIGAGAAHPLLSQVDPKELRRGGSPVGKPGELATVPTPDLEDAVAPYRPQSTQAQQLNRDLVSLIEDQLVAWVFQVPSAASAQFSTDV